MQRKIKPERYDQGPVRVAPPQRAELRELRNSLHIPENEDGCNRQEEKGASTEEEREAANRATAALW